MVLELTFAILKPHIIKNPVALNCIRNLILKENFKIVDSKRHSVTLSEASEFYKEHQEKFFYNRLITFMISGPSEFYILARNDAIKKWRSLMGPTKVYKAQFDDPQSIRAQFGLSDTRNATHGSDSSESVKREAGIFFPEFNIDEWIKYDEIYFRNNEVIFDKDKFKHVIKSFKERNS